MASNPPGKCCTLTNFHEGTVTGKVETINDLKTYVVGDSDSRVIVIATDIYGYEYNNVRLIGDQLAKAGYKVYIPDYLNGDYFAPGGDLGKWLESHTPEITTPLFKGFLSHLRETLGKSIYIGSIGYCFGGKFVIQELAQDGLLDAGAVAHPSFVTIEEVAAIKKPLLISAAETDPIFPAELRRQTEDKLAEIKARYQLDLFSGVEHGYAVRGDLANPVVKYAAEKTLTDQIVWFNLF